MEDRQRRMLKELMPYDLAPELRYLPRRRRKPPQMPMWLALKEGGRGARKHAGRQMRARKAGLASWAEQRHLGCPNLKAAWKGRDAYWRRWHHSQGLPADQAEADLERRRREVHIWSNAVLG